MIFTQKKVEQAVESATISTKNSIPQSEKFVNGENSHSRKDSTGRTLTDEQAEYFKDSKVRDEDGNLLVVYHGNDADFTVFDRNKIGSNYWQSGDSIYGGFYFTDKKSSAENYAALSTGLTGKGRVVEAYLNISNPLIRETGRDAFEYYDDNGYELLREADIYENDGIIIKGEGRNLYVAFESNQVKLTSNQNPTNNPDIRYSRTGDSLTGKEYNILNSKLMQKTGDIIELEDGGYAVPVGETVGTPNKLVITNGDVSNPSVETVFEINYSKMTISTTSIIGEYLDANSRQGLYQQKQNAEKIYGHGCIIEYSVSNSGYVRGENGRGKGVTGTKGGKSNGNSKQGVRYHWDAEGNFVKYSRRDSKLPAYEERLLNGELFRGKSEKAVYEYTKDILAKMSSNLKADETAERIQKLYDDMQRSLETDKKFGVTVINNYEAYQNRAQELAKSKQYLD